MKIAIQSSSQAHLISKFLSAAGYDCNANNHAANMLILDWPSWLRQAKTPTNLPILLLLDAADKTNNQLDQLSHFINQGMLEYIVMPIRYPELLLRTQILLQRAYPDSTYSTHSKPIDLIQFDQCDQYSFDVRTMSLMIHGQTIPTPLTKKEFELALLFFNNLNRPLSRAYIQETIWGHETDLPSRTIDTHVSRVRNKLQCGLAGNPDLVTVYGYGYCLQKS